MELPKFLLGDNTDFPEDIFIIHLDYPRFIINLKDDEVEILEEAEDLDESELNAEMEGLIVQANEFYDREVKRYEEWCRSKYIFMKLVGKSDISKLFTN